MDTETYDQLHVSRSTVGDAAKYLLENQDAHRRDPRRRARSTSSCPPPSSWSITYTEPGLQGDRSTGGTKPATLETGAEIAGPAVHHPGEKVKVDTRDGSYLGRVTLTASGGSTQQGAQAGARRPVRVRAARRRPPGDAGASAWPRADPPVNDYTVILVEGVCGSQREIDQAIGSSAREWSLDRMPAVDRTVLRLGAWELLHGDVPAGCRHRRSSGARQAAVDRRVAGLRQRCARPGSRATGSCGAPGGIRTHTGRILSPLPLPIGLRGPLVRMVSLGRSLRCPS